MGYNKEKYEKLINASNLFTLDPEKESSEYRKEKQKMIEYLYCYLMGVNKKRYEDYGMEIVDTATRCINNYEGGSVPFLHYFSAAWKTVYRRLLGNKLMEDSYRGLKFTDRENRQIKKFLRYFETKEVLASKEENLAKIAEFMDLSVDEVRRISEVESITVIGEYANNSEEEKFSIFDNVDIGVSIEDVLTKEESFVERLDKIERTFCSLQERQKPIVSDLLTARIGLDISIIEKQAKSYSFISKDIADIIKRKRKVPSQRDIADKYNKNESSISRTMKEFEAKLKKQG